ncbi:MAG: hypothetical protein WA771_11200 [Chthoniobacterales bacterium]
MTLLKIKSNPLADLKPVYERARDESMAMSPSDRVEDWLRTKRSDNGSSSRVEPVTYVSPVSGDLVRI